MGALQAPALPLGYATKLKKEGIMEKKGIWVNQITKKRKFLQKKE